MKHLITNLKENKWTIIKRVAIITTTITVIALVGYAATRNPDVLVIEGLDILELPEVDVIIL